MTDFIFGSIVLSLIASFILYVKETNKEKAKLINALIAKNSAEARDLTLADKVLPIKPQPAAPPDIVSTDTMSEEEFDEHIKDQLS